MLPPSILSLCIKNFIVFDASERKQVSQRFINLTLGDPLGI